MINKYKLVRVPLVAVVLGVAYVTTLTTAPGKLSSLWECEADFCLFTVADVVRPDNPTYCTAIEGVKNVTECRIPAPCTESLSTYIEANGTLMCQYESLTAVCSETTFREFCDEDFLVTPGQAHVVKSLGWAVLAMIVMAGLGETYRVMYARLTTYPKVEEAERDEEWGVAETTWVRSFSKMEIVKTAGSVLFMTLAVTLSMVCMVRDGFIGGAKFGDFYVAELTMFADKLVGLVLLLAAAVTVAWPTEPIFATHLLKRLEALQQETSEHARSTNDGTSVRFHSAGSEALSLTSSEDTLNSIINHTLTGDIALLVHSDGPVDQATIVSALGVFPPSHIFVVGRCGCPEPGEQVHDEVHFVSAPVPDKEEVNRFFDKFLADEEKFKYIMQIDSGSTLPGNMHFPKERFKNESDVNEVHLAVEPQNIIDKVSCHRISLFEQLKDVLASASFSFPEATLWRKGGLGSGKLIASLQTPVRVKTTESVNVPRNSSVGSLLWEVINPDTFRRRRGLGVAKIFALFQLLSVLCINIRLLFFAALAVRGLAASATALALHSVFAFAEFVLVEMVLLRKRADVRMPIWQCCLAPGLSLIYDLRYVAMYSGLDLLGKLRQWRVVHPKIEVIDS